jgi:peptide chain release factor 2/peptide chain release factor
MLILQISAGRGPVEVRRFVALLASELGSRLGAPVEFTGDPPASATLRVREPAWVGTHQLLAPLRGKGRRKRWFVEVRAFEECGGALRPDIVVTASRSGGPGGQNVNKRATAVRAVDRATGIAVRAADQRSQARNRALAERRLHARLAERARAAEEAAVASRRAVHDQVTRGGATYTWRIEGGRLVLHPLQSG